MSADLHAMATRSSWEQRVARAAGLAEAYSFAAELLTFYREITTFQKAFGQYLHSCNYNAGSGATLPSELDVFVVLPRLQTFLQLVESAGPEHLSRSARGLEEYGPERWSALLSAFWAVPEYVASSSAEVFVLRAFLQPLAEYLAERAEFDRSENYAQAVCPFCRRKPVVAVLRPEGDGAKRSLVCSFCSTEWQFRRIVCPACGETEKEKLPVFIAAEVDHVRVECCDTCNVFIKSVDLTKLGHAVPIVDELATVPLTLWAQEKGYTKLALNLLGM